MERRSFLKALAALGVAIALPADIAAATPAEIDEAWQSASSAWGLFEVNDVGTLSFANFEEPRTRAEAYGFGPGDLWDTGQIERYGLLSERICEYYGEIVYGRCEAEEEAAREAGRDYEWPDIEERVEREWRGWFDRLEGEQREHVEKIIDTWLDEEPDWNFEWDDLYWSCNAQGAAYEYFLDEAPEVRRALSIRIIEGEFPGSTYYAAELHIPVEEANRIAAERGWEIRFV